MKKTITPKDKIKINRSLIQEMIDASCELAEKKGTHDLENGCNCISCVNKRKSILNPESKWKFRI